MSVKRRRFIGVIGGSSAPESILDLARQVGLEIARRDLCLVTGGLLGVMQAAARGVCEGRERFGTSSLSVGVLPGGISSDANPYIDIAIPTGLGIARNVIVVRTADSLIAIDGGSGTLSEAAFGWQLGKPIVALATSGGCAAQLAGTAVDARRADVILTAHTPAEAVRLAAEVI